ncbi:helix-turn-helix transcriptional regulator [Neobacillus sp. 3P2-tot-E-2]|uniref:helix-turn-helix domain-containing protein n=1 Tax=Neobacillus sp. 3P2-tot-E-2 TaxID=3132212 RepID=UPI0039A00761
MDNDSHLDFGKALKRLRKDRKLSQEELADLSGLDRSYISILERNLKLPSLYTILALASGLGIKASEFMMEMENQVFYRVNAPF